MLQEYIPQNQAIWKSRWQSRGRRYSQDHSQRRSHPKTERGATGKNYRRCATGDLFQLPSETGSIKRLGALLHESQLFFSWSCYLNHPRLPRRALTSMAL
ncbi:hypothetical protein QR685DRAFT_212864 [Neurospora intermedia]|uniref:Uncharacterized protein n=1 Tax=Neurospora intermedia TaxID=5142 RepID=A0ABR3DGD2_NEUIN